MARLLVFAAISAVLLFTACSGQQTVPSALTTAASLDQGGQRRVIDSALIANPANTSWGIGLVAQPQVNDGSSYWTHYYCQNPPLGQNCPTYQYGKRTSSYSASKTLTNPQFGSFSVRDAATSNMGTQTYSLSDSGSGGSSQDSGPYATSAAVLRWTDVLHIKSTTLKKGAPVSLSVSLTLTPTQTAVACDPLTESGGSIQVDSPGVDSFGGDVRVSGDCASGVFVYTIGPGAGGSAPGTTDTGVLSGVVGGTIDLAQGSLAVSTEDICASPCIGSFSAALAGTAKWTITGITPGASYTSSSGNTYQ